MRRLLLLATCFLGVGAASAHAAGGPVPPVQGGAGVSAPGSSLAYIAVRAGRDTVLQRVRRADGVVERSRLLRGSYGVPGAAYDGSNTGLSFDKHTLVLAAIQDHSRDTRLLTLDARSLRPREQIVLPGYMTVDAISPDGRWLYLIRYRSVRNNRYDVVAYDLARGHLLRTPIVDPREPDEKMQGFPLTRAVSPDGRWAYTLYADPEGEPFIHALDTERRTAACIDLDDVSTEDASDARLVLAGGTLRVDGTAGPLALVDTRTFAVSDPAAAKVAPARRVASSGDDGGGGGVPWFVAFVALVPLAGLAVVARRRRHASSA
jgi:MYXO-CTERM domain-containing protein